MKNQNSVSSLVTLGNGSELVRCIAQGVIGNEVADTFQGSDLDRSTLYSLAQSEFNLVLGTKLGSK